MMVCLVVLSVSGSGGFWGLDLGPGLGLVVVFVGFVVVVDVRVVEGCCAAI